MSITGSINALARQTAIYGVSSVIGRLLNWLLVPLYTRIFLPEEYGVVTELYAYAGFMVVLYTYGMETAFFRYTQKIRRDDVFMDHPRLVYSTGIWSLLITSLLFSGLLIAFSKNIAIALQYPGHVQYIIWFALILAMDALAALPFARLRLEERPIRFAVVKLANIGTNIGFNLFFILLCPYLIQHHPGFFLSGWLDGIYDESVGVGYIFISNLLASGITLLLLLPQLLDTEFRFHARLWQKMLVYALPVLVAGLAYVTNEMLDKILLKYLLKGSLDERLAQIGIYGACYKLSFMMTLFVQAYRYAAEPFFFRQASTPDAREKYALTMRYFVIAGSLIYAGIMLYLDVIKLFIGPDYHEGLAVVPLLLMANLFLGIYYNLSVWYKITDRTYIGALISLAGALITVVLNIILIPVMGYMGAAWTTLICYGTMALLSYLGSLWYYRIPYPLKSIAIYLIFAPLIYLFSARCLQWFSIEGTVQVLLFNTVIFTTCLIVIWAIEKRHLRIIQADNADDSR